MVKLARQRRNPSKHASATKRFTGEDPLTHTLISLAVALAAVNLVVVAVVGINSLPLAFPWAEGQ